MSACSPLGTGVALHADEGAAVGGVPPHPSASSGLAAAAGLSSAAFGAAAGFFWAALGLMGFAADRVGFGRTSSCVCIFGCGVFFSGACAAAGPVTATADIRSRNVQRTCIVMPLPPSAIARLLKSPPQPV